MNIHLPQCEAPKIAKLVYNSNNYGLWMFMVFITIVTGANLNQLTSLWGLTLQLFWCSPGVRFRFLTPISQKNMCFSLCFLLLISPDVGDLKHLTSEFIEIGIHPIPSGSLW